MPSSDGHPAEQVLRVGFPRNDGQGGGAFCSTQPLNRGRNRICHDRA